MKKVGLCLVLAALLVLPLSGVSWAGLCIDDEYCNDFFFALSAKEGIYELHGYEYGCGQPDKLATGSLRVAGAYAYVGFSIVSDTSGIGTYGDLAKDSSVIDMATWTGPGNWTYFYESGGSVYAIAGSDSKQAYTCSNPSVASQTSEPDRTMQ